jgi:peptidoglycan hydrolase-like protein with peptidoglycan-binding domain
MVSGAAAAETASAHETTAKASNATAGKRPLLKYGSRGPAVVWVQRKLGVRPTSGWYGPRTRAAVKRYQRAHGIPQTGKVGPKTWASLLGKRASRSRTRVSTNVQSLNWRALARCESSNNPRAVNPAGYYGLYQFNLGTWRSVGGSGYPHRASAAEQTKRAQILYTRRGAQPWPTCGRLLFT